MCCQLSENCTTFLIEWNQLNVMIRILKGEYNNQVSISDFQLKINLEILNRLYWSIFVHSVTITWVWTTHNGILWKTTGWCIEHITSSVSIVMCPEWGSLVSWHWSSVVYTFVTGPLSKVNTIVKIAPKDEKKNISEMDKTLWFTKVKATCTFPGAVVRQNRRFFPLLCCRRFITDIMVW